MVTIPSFERFQMALPLSENIKNQVSNIKSEDLLNLAKRITATNNAFYIGAGIAAIAALAAFFSSKKVRKCCGLVVVLGACYMGYNSQKWNTLTSLLKTKISTP